MFVVVIQTSLNSYIIGYEAKNVGENVSELRHMLQFVMSYKLFAQDTYKNHLMFFGNYTISSFLLSFQTLLYTPSCSFSLIIDIYKCIYVYILTL